MATDTAGKWIIGILVYFLILFSVLFFISNLKSTYSFSDSSVTYSGGSGGVSLGNIGGCDNPRQVGKYTDKCKRLIEIGSVYDNNSCESVSGCTWETKDSLLATLTLGFFGSTDYTCTGEINLTHYNAGDDFSFYGITGIQSYSFCDLENLSDSAETCEFFGCTWYSSTTDDLMSYEGVTGLWKITKDIVGLNVNFSSSSTMLNTILNFIFIVIPSILLILAGMIFIRG